MACKTTPPDICQQPSLAQAVQELSQHSLTAPWVTWNKTLERPKRVQLRLSVETSNPEEATKQIISQHAKLFKLSGNSDELVLKHTRQGKAGTYLRFEQQYQGLPVFGGEVISQTKTTSGRTEVQQLNLAHLEVKPLASLTPSIDESRAIDVARKSLSLTGRERIPTQVRLGIWPTGEQRLAYEVMLATEAPISEFTVYIDAKTGDMISYRNMLRYVNGTGLVYDPSAVAATGNTNLTDGNDQNSTALDNARVSVTLPRLDGSGFLRGTFVDVRPPQINQRASDANNTFNFQRADNRFEEVMAYFHVDRTQNRIQSLGFNDVNNRVQIAIADFDNQDNSFYSPGDKQIRFGQGGVDDAEDGDIIMHEYGHSIHDNQVPGWGGGDEGAMGEGFGDYLAASFSDTLTNQISDVACVGDWDATSYDNRNPPCLRRVDEPKHFPEFFQGQVHADGEMWSSALFSARDELGADVMDTLLLESHFSLSTNETFEDAFLAIVAADNALFFGQHVAALKRHFIEQGISREITAPANLPNVQQSITANIQNPRNNNIYADFLDNTQTFTQAGAAGLRVHFAQFQTELDNACFDGACDSVYLYDGQGRLFQILNGNLGAFDSVVIPGDTVRIRLVTDVSVGQFGYRVDRIDVMSANGGGAVCGNAVIEAGEQCDDGNTVNGDACEANCTLPVCGNNIQDQNEQCDGNDLDNQSCVSQGFAGGNLSCNNNCSFNTNACTAPASCGDGALNNGEDCDGNNLGGASCVSEGFDGGALSCNNNCSFNTNACTNNGACGDGSADAGEECDGADLNGESCASQGFGGGNLSCNNNCTLNTNACTADAVCGNNTLEPGEQCDGAPPGNLSCQSLGFDAGALSCSGICTIDSAGCSLCGNGIREGNEACDGQDFGGQTCEDQGLANGALSCSVACTIETAACLPAECR
jgi:cysteine-rich repeat protein